MDDLISRQNTIDIINRKWINGTNLCNADEAIDKIKKLPSAQQWIPCSERLPEDNVDVLAQGSDYYTAILSFRYDIKMWEDGYGYNIDQENVIAWMPLPEPYAELPTKLNLSQGDEVIWHETDQDSFKAVILDDDADVYDYVFIFTEVGCIERASVKSLELTGKHYDNLETLLKFLQRDSADHICKNCKCNQWNNFLEGSICKNRDSSNFGELTSGKYATFTSCEYWQKKED